MKYNLVLGWSIQSVVYDISRTVADVEETRSASTRTALTSHGHEVTIGFDCDESRGHRCRHCRDYISPLHSLG